MDRREVATLAPIMALCLVLGLYPQPVIDVARQDLDIVADIVKKRQDVLYPPNRVAGSNTEK
jgi:NADH:ubiquinone oxidoreductase subunit 4 (subunit M)